MDPQLVIEFVRSTQKESWKALEEQYEAQGIKVREIGLSTV